MPQVLNPPIYGASRDALCASYSPSFSGDLQIVVPLFGSFQGDPVHAVTLMIDNYNNGIPVAYTLGGLVDYIPAYTTQYIDVSKMDTIRLSATDTVSIGLSLYNVHKDGGRSRGLPPNGLSDPYWSAVLGLWHCDGNNGASIAPDSRNPGLYMGVPNSPIISTVQSQFGGSSIHIVSGGLYNIGETYANAGYVGDFTWELSAYPNTAPAATSCYISTIGEGNGGIGLSLRYEKDPGSANVRFAVYREQGNTLLCATPYSYAIGAWYSLGLTSQGGFSLYVNGVFIVSGGLKNPLFGNIVVGVQNPTYDCFIDEIRLTAGTRYIKSYTPAGQAFPNQ